MSSDENSPSDTEENSGLSMVHNSPVNHKEPPPLIHFLKCPECSFITTQKRRFESHFPCALHDEPTRYFLYVCHLCRGMCTDRGIMEEHKETYHKGSQVNILEQQEVIKPLSMKNGTHTLSPGKANNNNNHPLGVNLNSSGQHPAATGAPPHFLFSQPIACPVCKVICMGGADELVSHLQLVHSHHVGSSGTNRSRSPVSHHFSANGQPPSGLQLQPSSIASLSQCFTSSMTPSTTPLGLNSQTSSWPTAASSPLQQLHQCGLCQAVFRTPRQLDAHIAAIHPRAVEQCNPSAGSIPPGLHQLQAAILAAAAASDSKVTPLHLAHAAHLSKMVAPPSMGEDPRDLSPPETKRLRIHEGHLSISPPHSNGLPSLVRGGQVTPSGAIHVTPKGPSRSSPTSNLLGSCNVNASGNSPPASVIENGIVHNTLRKTKSDIKVIRRYLLHVKGEHREIHLLPPEDLAAYLQDFVLTARKKDGNEYEPESLKAFVHSLERHLKYHNYPASVLKDTTFATTRTILHQRLLELRAMSRVVGSGSKTSQVMTTPELIQAGILGADNPQALLNTLWLFNRTYFNIGGTQRHKNLVWGQFQVVTSAEGEDYLQYTPNFSHEETRFFKGGINSSNPDQLPLDCVEIFRIYANMRPMEARGLQDAFYLTPDQAWEQGGSWFRAAAAGVQLISKVPKLIGLKSRGSSGKNTSRGDDADESRTGDSNPGSPMMDEDVTIYPSENEVDEQEEAVDMTSGTVGVPLQIVS